MRSQSSSRRWATLLVVALSVAPTDLVHGQIVFSVNRAGRWEVVVLSDPGATPMTLAQEGQPDAVAPAIAPDGRRVAFELPGVGIRICPLSGSGSCSNVTVSDGYGVRPAWRPRTGELLFVRYQVVEGVEESDLFITTPVREGSRPLIVQTGTQDYPDVSPEGRYLAYTSTVAVSLRGAAAHVVQQLWVMDLQSGRARQLLATEAQDIQPDWSPSGREIAFASNRSGRFEIWIVGTDGTALRQLTDGPGAKTWPAWSPDGRSILFTVVRDGRHGLWMIDVDGSNLRPFQPFGPDSRVELRDADWR